MSLLFPVETYSEGMNSAEEFFTNVSDLHSTDQAESQIFSNLSQTGHSRSPRS